MASEANHSRVAPLVGADDDGASPEISETDAADLRPVTDDNGDDWPSGVSFDPAAEVSEADAAEQLREVRVDEEDYR